MDQEQSDSELVARSRAGDDQAFSELVQRHRGALKGVIWSKVGRSDEVEDLLQDALFTAWRKLPSLREPSRVKPWLLQIARNRCRDYWRAPARRVLQHDPSDLEQTINSSGRASRVHPEAAERLKRAIEAQPQRQRDLLAGYYLEGRSVSEMADRMGSACGTIQRQLHEARAQMRQYVTTLGELLSPAGIPMEEAPAYGTEGLDRAPRPHGFPELRPEIQIVEADSRPMEIDCRELRWWFTVPETDRSTAWAVYEGVDWHLSEVFRTATVGPARIHGLDGVEIRLKQWRADEGWAEGDTTMYARLTDDAAQWLAIQGKSQGATKLRSFLDEDFEKDWGTKRRRLAAEGQFARTDEESFQRISEGEGPGAGVAVVTIDGRSHTCVRVLEIGQGADMPDERGALVEGFLDQDGHTVLSRRYNGCLWSVGDGSPWSQRPWDEELPGREHLVIDGVVFVHWYDCLSASAIGRD